MNPKQHARLARSLIIGCDGLEEAASACRVNKSSLSTYQNPNETATMPADVIADLEEYCGEGIYSRALARRSHGMMPSNDVIGDALKLNDAAAHFACTYHQALHGTQSPGQIDAQEQRDLENIMADVRRLLNRVDAEISK